MISRETYLENVFESGRNLLGSEDGLGLLGDAVGEGPLFGELSSSSTHPLRGLHVSQSSLLGSLVRSPSPRPLLVPYSLSLGWVIWQHGGRDTVVEEGVLRGSTGVWVSLDDLSSGRNGHGGSLLAGRGEQDDLLDLPLWALAAGDRDHAWWHRHGLHHGVRGDLNSMAVVPTRDETWFLIKDHHIRSPMFIVNHGRDRLIDRCGR